MARSPAIILAAAALALVSPTAETAAADLILVERPWQLVLLDRYQQTMPLQARRQLTPFLPIVVRNPAATLGDGVTPCLSVEIAGVRAYVLLDEGGGLAGRKGAGFVRFIRGAELLPDTVEVLAAVSFSTPDLVTSRTLPRGERLITWFQHEDRLYTRRMSGGFGWIPAARTGWRSVRRGSAGQQASGRRETDIVQNSLTSANVVFASLFSRPGVRPPTSGGAPRWELEVGDAGLRCVLTRLDPAWGRKDFSGSTEMLARELQTLLLGRNMSVTSVPGVITIRYLNSAQETR